MHFYQDVYLHARVVGWLILYHEVKETNTGVTCNNVKLMIMNSHLIIDPNLKPLQMTCLEEDVH